MAKRSPGVSARRRTCLAIFQTDLTHVSMLQHTHAACPQRLTRIAPLRRTVASRTRARWHTVHMALLYHKQGRHCVESGGNGASWAMSGSHFYLHGRRACARLTFVFARALYHAGQAAH